MSRCHVATQLGLRMSQQSQLPVLPLSWPRGLRNSSETSWASSPTLSSSLLLAFSSVSHRKDRRASERRLSLTLLPVSTQPPLLTPIGTTLRIPLPGLHQFRLLPREDSSSPVGNTHPVLTRWPLARHLLSPSLSVLWGLSSSTSPGRLAQSHRVSRSHRLLYERHHPIYQGQRSSHLFGGTALVLRGWPSQPPSASRGCDPPSSMRVTLRGRWRRQRNDWECGDLR